MNLLRLLSAKLNFLACPGCGSGDGRGINDLCDECCSKLLFFSGHYCKNCGGELDGVLACCSKCMKEGDRPYLEGVSVFSYRSYGKELILKYKSGKSLPFARIFSRMAAERLQTCCTHWDFEMIVPVPLHWSRKFSRTFNQSQLLADFLSKEINKPYSSKVLRRIRRTKSQKFLSGEERHKNLRDAFKADRTLAEGRKILLIDDVFTTGATLSCCAAELLNAGAERVYVLSIARA